MVGNPLRVLSAAADVAPLPPHPHFRQDSSVGNKFQELASQSYAARFPVSVAPGNQ